MDPACFLDKHICFTNSYHYDKFSERIKKINKLAIAPVDKFNLKIELLLACRQFENDNEEQLGKEEKLVNDLNKIDELIDERSPSPDDLDDDASNSSFEVADRTSSPDVVGDELSDSSIDVDETQPKIKKPLKREKRKGSSGLYSPECSPNKSKKY